MKIVIDWGRGAITPDYAVSRLRVEPVSKVVAKFVNVLIANQFATNDNIAIAGHSLGAHIAGLSGKKIVGGKVKTIFGLDPAGPLFDPNNPAQRLAATDA